MEANRLTKAWYIRCILKENSYLVEVSGNRHEDFCGTFVLLRMKLLFPHSCSIKWQHGVCMNVVIVAFVEVEDGVSVSNVKSLVTLDIGHCFPVLNVPQSGEGPFTHQMVRGGALVGKSPLITDEDSICDCTVAAMVDTWAHFDRRSLAAVKGLTVCWKNQMQQKNQEHHSGFLEREGRTLCFILLWHMLALFNNSWFEFLITPFLVFFPNLLD